MRRVVSQVRVAPSGHEYGTTQQGVPAAAQWFLTGVGASVLGDEVWFVALTWSAAQLGHASTVLATATLPQVAFLLFGGEKH